MEEERSQDGVDGNVRMNQPLGPSRRRLALSGRGAGPRRGWRRECHVPSYLKILDGAGWEHVGQHCSSLMRELSTICILSIPSRVISSYRHVDLVVAFKFDPQHSSRDSQHPSWGPQKQPWLTYTNVVACLRWRTDAIDTLPSRLS
jgi:hypothetical protein